MKKIIIIFLAMCCVVAACTETSEGFLDSKGMTLRLSLRTV